MSSDGYNQSGVGGQTMVRLLIAVVVGALAMGFVAIRGCQRGPFGRVQLAELNAEDQLKLGKQAYAEVLQDAQNKGQIISSGPVVAEVREVTNRLVRATKNPDFLRTVKIPDRPYEWEVQVVQSKEVNAFCLPGGKMVVYTAILPVCETDAGLATVMGHEIAHALGQHGAERMTQTKMAKVGITAAGTTLSGMNPNDQQKVMQVLNAGAQFGILKYSRKHESEADHIGLLLMAAAGYDPEESVKFWTRMAKATGGGKRPPEFLSTHPSHETRIRDLTKWIPEAMPFYKASPTREERPKKLTLPRRE